MKFKLGPLPENEDFHPSATGWCRLREPSPLLLHALAIPTAVGVMGLTFLCLRIFTPQDKLRIDMTLVWWAIPILIPVHELVHAITTPCCGLSDKTVVGFWPRKLLPYAIYTDALNRSRIIWLIVMPFLTLTVLPAIGMCMFGLGWPLLYHFILVNAGFSSGDILQVPIFCFQVPRHALVRNKGYKSYWRAVRHGYDMHAGGNSGARHCRG